MKDFVCFSINNWEKRKARKQQFALHLSQRDDVGKVLYVEPALNFFRLIFFPFSELRGEENKKRWKRALKFCIEPITEKLFLYTPVRFLPLNFRFQFIYDCNLVVIYQILKKRLRKEEFSNVVLWLYHPMDYKLLKIFKDRVLSIFDWAERWGDYFIELKPQRRKEVVELEQKMAEGVDIVFAVSKGLLNRAQKVNTNSYRMLDGTVYEVFQGPNKEVPEDIKNIKKPILGYLGTINERVDISRLKSKENIYFLGGKFFEELGAYAQCFDVCVLPYRVDLVMGFPTKVLDYLATGKPIVSTHLVGIEAFEEMIIVSHSASEFIENTRKALNENDSGQMEARLKKAQENTWDRRVAEISDKIRLKS